MATRGPEFNHLLSDPPPGVDPFSLLSGIIVEAVQPHLTRPTYCFLVVFLIFHIFVSCFCLVILVLPLTGRAARPQWIMRRLYVNERSEENAYQTPLYLANPRIVMTMSQLLGSASAIAYIWVIIKSSVSPHYAVRNQFMPALGLMYVFELWAHWSMSHCFLVTVYYGQENLSENPRSITRFLRFLRPALINALFILFPAFAATISLGFNMRTAFIQKDLSDATVNLLAALGQGASIRNEIEMKSGSAQEKAGLSSQLNTLVSEIKKNGIETAETVDKMIHSVYISQYPLLIFMSICCLLFVTLFSILARKYLKRGHRACRVALKTVPIGGSVKPDLAGEQNHTEQTVISQSQIGILMSNHQFFNLALRSFAMVMAMLSSVVFCLLSLAKPTEMVLDPYWHSVATWLTTVSGVWSAIPIALQCWRLYIDQVRPRYPSGNQESLVCSKQSQRSGTVLEIKIRDSIRPYLNETQLHV